MDQLWVASKCPPSVFGVNKIPFELTYRAKVKNIPANAKNLDLWIPYPQDTRAQTISDIRVKSPYPVQINAEPEFGNKIMYIKVKNPKNDFEIEIKISAVRQEIIAARFIEANVRKLQNKAGNFNRYLGNQNKVEPLAKEALKKGIVGTNIDKAKSMYDYLLNNYKYDSEILSSMLKSQNIPVNNINGFKFKNSSEGSIRNYSSWTEFFIAGYGWIPIDLDSAKKFPKEQDYYFGNVDEYRIELVEGRGINLVPKQKGKPLNVWVYPYAEIDGKEFEVDKNISWRKEL